MYNLVKLDFIKMKTTILVIGAHLLVRPVLVASIIALLVIKTPY